MAERSAATLQLARPVSGGAGFREPGRPPRERSVTPQPELAEMERSAACVPPRPTVTRSAIRGRGRHARRRGDDIEDLKAFVKILVMQKLMIWQTGTLTSGVNDYGNLNMILMRNHYVLTLHYRRLWMASCPLQSCK